MSFRYPKGGYITAFYDPLQVPNAPTIGTASDVGAGGTISVAFTAPINVGGSAITGYTAISDPGEFEGTGTSSPVTVTGLTDGTPYTFRVWATNSYGPSAYSAVSGSATPSSQRALFGGGEGDTANIQYSTIPTLGNTTSFGNLTVGRGFLSGLGSATRGVFGGGRTTSATYFNTIDYVTILSTGNATDFGDLNRTNASLAALSSSTRGIFAGGINTGSFGSATNVIDYITIASAGNATDFGDLTLATCQLAGCSSTTRGLFGGGADSAGANTNVISYVTIASAGNATDFGDLAAATGEVLASCSSATRGVFAGGSTGGTRTNTINYVTIASAGNATDFGDLTEARARLAGASSLTRGLFGGGFNTSNAAVNTIDYITIATTGNAISFGSLTGGARRDLGACSNCHGGL